MLSGDIENAVCTHNRKKHLMIKLPSWRQQKEFSGNRDQI